MNTTHFDATLSELGADKLTRRQRAWAARRVRAQRRRDMLEWAATAGVFATSAAAVVYTYSVGGWWAAAVATVLIAAAATVGGWAAGR